MKKKKTNRAKNNKMAEAEDRIEILKKHFSVTD